jgi:hypothetical protein
MRKRDNPLRHWLVELCINQLVIKTDARSINPGIGVVDMPKTRSINCAQAHRARLATCVEFTI